MKNIMFLILLGGLVLVTACNEGNNAGKPTEPRSDAKNVAAVNSRAITGIRTVQLPIDSGNIWIKQYCQTYEPRCSAQEPKSWLANAASLKMMLNLPDCRYLHVSLAVKDSGAGATEITLVFSALDKKYNHVFLNNGGQPAVLECVYPCPPCYDTEHNEAGGMFRANDTLGPEGADHVTYSGAITSEVKTQYVSVALADTWIKYYLNGIAKTPSRTNEPVGWIISAILLKDYLEDVAADGKYVHFLRGLRGGTGPEHNTLVLAAADNQYHHQYAEARDNPQILESVYPCPFCIDAYAHPYGSFKARDTLIPTAHLPRK